MLKEIQLKSFIDTLSLFTQKFSLQQKKNKQISKGDFSVVVFFFLEVSSNTLHYFQMKYHSFVKYCNATFEHQSISISHEKKSKVNADKHYLTR